ncbi:ATP synthase F1 subunit epsilon [Chitinophagales bacterium]|nr:ATP synthase F1 subunit epsilon [Chitinophagales bacterium]
MQLEILTPEARVFEGTVTAVSFPGIGGRFQVLENHAPLISALGEGELRLESAEGNKTVQISSGFVEVLRNKVIVLIEGTIND